MSAESKAVLITGGAGFVGCNVAHRLLSSGRRVVLFDNISRPGVERNLAWLKKIHGARVEIEIGDVRDADMVTHAVARASHVFHFAAQVAVTTSLHDPRRDFDTNARGTLNVLEAIRAQPDPPSIVFTSTNKVYGGLDDLALTRLHDRYVPIDCVVSEHGIPETRPLDFHSPYGCSKGAADQLVIDYARSFGIRSVVFRMSCIYGPHQFGTEDQGWVAHFVMRAIDGEQLVLYGDGMQVRDLLFVDDLVDAMLLAQDNIGDLAGRAFNMGGGTAHTTSLLELMRTIGDLQEEAPRAVFDDWRMGDQRYYVSDTRRFQNATGWRPRTSVADGVRRLHDWLMEVRGSSPPLKVARTTLNAQRPRAAERRLVDAQEVSQ